MIKKATAEDTLILAELAACMWDSSIEKLKREFDELLKNKNAAVFLKYHSDDPVGFVYCRLRTDYTEYICPVSPRKIKSRGTLSTAFDDILFLSF